jgi:hypothetical protein
MITADLVSSSRDQANVAYWANVGHLLWLASRGFLSWGVTSGLQSTGYLVPVSIPVPAAAATGRSSL